MNLPAPQRAALVEALAALLVEDLAQHPMLDDEDLRELAHEAAR